MHKPAAETLYERDFYAWTQDQAQRLRGHRGDDRLDAEHLAEEVEDLGKRDRRALRSRLMRALQHLCKAAVAPSDDLQVTWIREVRTHLHAAREIVEDSPSLPSTLDLQRIWSQAIAEANADLRDYGDPEFPAKGIACPFGLDDLLSADFDAWHALRGAKAVLDGSHS